MNEQLRNKRILITGASGQLGRDISQMLSRLEVEQIGPPSKEMDITRFDAVKTVFESFRPDIVFHCAAYNQVDRAETEIEQCRAVNVTGSMNLAQLCNIYNCYLLAFSSDYVFDGTKSGEYETDDAINPLSIYGRSKADAEASVLGESDRSAVIRTSWLFGPGRHNFVESILRKGKTESEICVVSDQVGSPTYTEDLAALSLRFAEEQITGLYHATNEGFCSRSQFAVTILNTFGTQCRVREISSEELNVPAKRPKNSRLSKSCLDQAGLERLPLWDTALERYLMRYLLEKR